MRRIVAVIVVVAGAFVGLRRTYSPPRTTVTAPQSAPAAPGPPVRAATPAVSPSSDLERDEADFERAITEHAHDVRVHGDGLVARILPDDKAGERHERFIVRLPTSESILIAHNIDIAPRVEGLRVGDRVEFEGEYVWNDKGGVVHWTHHDPSGRHRTGFLLVHGHKYQ